MAGITGVVPKWTVDPDLAVALGAAAFAGILEGEVCYPIYYPFDRVLYIVGRYHPDPSNNEGIYIHIITGDHINQDLRST